MNSRQGGHSNCYCKSLSDKSTWFDVMQFILISVEKQNIYFQDIIFNTTILPGENYPKMHDILNFRDGTLSLNHPDYSLSTLASAQPPGVQRLLN